MQTSLSALPARLMAGALVLGATVLGATTTLAGECPAEHVLKQPRVIEEQPDLGIGRETLAVVHLKGWRGVGDLYLRTRKLIIAKDGVIPTHQHDDRPSIVVILKGELIEHSSFCAVPILHREGEWSPEFGPGHAHWWENKTGKEVIVLSSDLIPPEYFDPGSEHLKHDM